MKPHNATLILVLGIVGLTIFPPLGTAGWIWGSMDLKKMNAGTMDPTGRGMTKVGKTCGMIATILGVIYVIFFLLVGPHIAG